MSAEPGRLPIPPQAGTPAGLDRERVILLDVVARARSAAGAALVIRGAPGTGKSALLDSVRRDAPHALDLFLSGDDTAAAPFAGLRELIGPFGERARELPPPQARTIRRVLRGREEERYDRLSVGGALLRMLGEVARERPVLVRIDDADRLDHPSLDVLAYTARRLGPEQVVMMFTVTQRPPDQDAAWLQLLHGLPSLILKPCQRTA